MRTSNPALKDNVFRDRTAYPTDPMTMEGTVTKTALALLLLTAAAAYTWNQVAPTSGFEGLQLTGNPMPYLLIGSLGGFIVSLITIFKPTTAPVTVPIYSVLEGLSLGALSAIFETRYPGIVMQSVVGTFGTLAALLLAYRTGFVRATDSFRRGVFAATGGIALLFFVSMILRLFHVPMNFLYDSSPLSIGISVVVVVVASLNLVLDFDFIERGARSGAPKHMEWYGAFGLMVTLVWLYLEIIRLLGKVRDRR